MELDDKKIDSMENKAENLEQSENPDQLEVLDKTGEFLSKEDLERILADAELRMAYLYLIEREKGLLEEEEPEESLLHKFIHIICVPALVGLLIALTLTQVIFFHAEVPSGSMETTIMTGDRIVGNRLYLWFAKPQHGDIMIFWSDEYDKFLVKRVIGCPGDVVELRGDGTMYVNEQQISTEYTLGITRPVSRGGAVWHVPENKYLMFGDNREESADSRYWVQPFIPLDDMYAKVFLRYSLGRNGLYVYGMEPVDFYME